MVVVPVQVGESVASRHRGDATHRYALPAEVVVRGRRVGRERVPSDVELAVVVAAVPPIGVEGQGAGGRCIGSGSGTVWP